jgi:hypothetical protein
MPGEKRGALPVGNAPTSPTASASRQHGTLAETDAASPNLGERIVDHFGCCDHEADATYRIDKHTGQPRWFISSFSARCPGGKECLKRVCEWLAELGIEVTPVDLLTDPRPALIAAGGKGSRQADEAPPRPSHGQIGGWHSRLLEQQNARVLNYLLGRGISLEIVERWQVGWDGRYLTFPMRGRFLKRRLPRDGARMLNIPGKERPWPLYPRIPRDAGRVLLAAGELDALCVLSAGVPAVSVTLGAGAWRDAWTDELRGLAVTVCFDNNESELAERRVRELRAAGLNACRLDLRTLGLTMPKGDLSDYLNAGGDPNRLMPPGRRAR